MSSRRIDSPRRAVRWLLPTALLALAPKCLLCLAAYTGLGVALGVGGPEICGASTGTSGAWAWTLTWLGVAGGIGTLGCLTSIRGCERRFRPNPNSAR